jgi:hypothetical protein
MGQIFKLKNSIMPKRDQKENKHEKYYNIYSHAYVQVYSHAYFPGIYRPKFILPSQLFFDSSV